MPQLTKLTIVAENDLYLNFERIKCSNLSYLSLDGFKVVGDSLRIFLTSCSNLQNVQINNFRLQSWSVFFAAGWKSLRFLKLWNNRVHQNAMRISKRLNTLKELKIGCCHIPTKKLIELVLRCPNLEKLELASLKAVDDEFVSILDRMPQLKELEIRACPITDKSVEFITENCSHLLVTIHCDQVSSVAKKLLNRVTRKQEHFSNICLPVM